MAGSKRKTKTKTKTKAVSQKGLSDRARLAGLRSDTSKTPNLTVTVRIRKKGQRGNSQRWHRDKLVTYVCEKISQGRLVSDVCRKIGIQVPVFWRIVDTTDTYRRLYAQARKDEAEQMKIYATKVAEGRDWISIREKKRIAKLRKSKKLADQMYATTRENNILGRNRLQVDTAKWYAKVTDPEKFGDKQSLAIGGDASGAPVAISVRFVDAKGKEIKP